MVYTGGEKPNRIIVTVDETYLDVVSTAEKTYKLETVTILENAKSPDWVFSIMIIDYFTKDRGNANDAYRHCSHIFGRFDCGGGGCLQRQVFAVRIKGLRRCLSARMRPV